MEKQDTRQLLEILRVAYPSHYRNMSEPDQRQTLALYYECFRQVPTDVIVYALKNYIKANQYPPTIAGLQEQIELLSPKKETSSDLWVKLERAIGRSAYEYVDEFEKLPTSIQRWLGGATALHKLSQQDMQTTQSVTRGQFLKTIDGITAEEKAQSQLPDNLKALVGGMTERMALTDGE